MTRVLRFLLLCTFAGAALVTAGCEAPHERTVGETEAAYLDLDGLRYQVQISRQLNPADVEDSEYFTGVEDTDLGQDHVWYGVFLQVANPHDEELRSAEEFHIVDTQHNEFEPVELDPEINNWAYEPRVLGPREMIPAPDSAVFNGPTRGALLLFRLERQTMQNRPLELVIGSVEDAEQTAIVTLDV